MCEIIKEDNCANIISSSNPSMQTHYVFSVMLMTVKHENKAEMKHLIKMHY